MTKRVVVLLLAVQEGSVACLTAGPYLRLPWMECPTQENPPGITEVFTIAREKLGFGVANARQELRVDTRDRSTIAYVAHPYHYDPWDPANDGMGVRWVPYEELRTMEMVVDYDHNHLPMIADILEIHYSEVGT